MKKIYLIHHSHTDIGYTDLQEKIIYNHINYIYKAMDLILAGYENDTEMKHFKWNCESYFAVERFLDDATEAQRVQFFDLVKKGNIGLSATYLNFTDLVDKYILDSKTKQMVQTCKDYNTSIKVAMNADINGIPLGALDVFLENGIEFLFTNVHCHHGMYPLYKNQVPYYWERNGKKLLVWSGEHYHLSNSFGLVPTKPESADLVQVEKAYAAIMKYIAQCDANGYKYDFIPLSISGVFSDNAPPNAIIMEMINAFNAYTNEIQLEMLTIEELYSKIADKLIDVPTYSGDLTDWWSHGVGSTPYAVKHAKEAVRIHRICQALDASREVLTDQRLQNVENNLLLFAEHTWGHSSTISNPYDTMVQNLDIRNISYASKAHESASENLVRILHKKGDILQYYGRSGKVKAINPSNEEVTQVVSFYIEVWGFGDINVVCNGVKMVTQIGAHPRGIEIKFVDTFAAHEEKIYTYQEIEKAEHAVNSGIAHIGSERIQDIVNEYDPIICTLPYQLENEWFKISYESGLGVRSFYNKVENCEMLVDGAKFFEPIYEVSATNTNAYEERRLLGRNIRGLHAKKYHGRLENIQLLAHGKVYTEIELTYKLEGTKFSSIIIRVYHQIPKIDFKYKVAKTLVLDPESLYLPLALNIPAKKAYVDKADATFRPGVEQIPGTCMEYYLIDNGIIYQNQHSSIYINTLDAPLIYMGQLKSHPITLCNNEETNNDRPIYSWIMNNLWETNFKINLSGITEYCYSLGLVLDRDISKTHEAMKDNAMGITTFIIE